MSDPVVENVVRHNGPNVPQHVVAESVSEGTMGSVRDVAWFWEKDDAEEYVKLLAEARARAKDVLQDCNRLEAMRAAVRDGDLHDWVKAAQGGA